MTEVVELQKLKLAELKQECAARGLEVKGNKSELIARLQLYLEEHEEVNEEEVLGGYGEDSSDKEEREETQELAKHEDVTEKKVVKVTPPASASERMQKRAERFNMPPSADSKKAARAARFGMPAADSLKGTSAKVNVDVEVLKKRAERFGMNVSSVSKKVEDDEKLKKRKERFGVLTSSASAGTDDSEAKKRKRAERFGNV